MAATTSLGRWSRRFAIALVLATLCSTVGIAAGYWYMDAKWAKAKDIELQLDVGTGNYLIIGSDSREGVQTDQDAESFGTVGGRRADTLLIVRVDPKTRKALMVSFPRDLWVDLPSGGGGKINGAFSEGPQQLVDAFRQNFDIPIHHYVQIDFFGFRNIVDAMGGVQMFVSAPARDFKTGLNIEQAGCTTLDGPQALAWVRSRNYQFHESGQWRNDPTGDFGRISRQQDFLRRLIAQGIDTAANNPLKGNRLIDTGLENVTVDSELAAGEVLKLVQVFRSADPDDVEMLTVPGHVGRRGSQSVVVLDEAQAAPIFERLREGGEAGAATPQTTNVSVLNGVGTAGLASRTARQLQEAGFLIPPGGIGDADRLGYEETLIRFRPGNQPKAELVQDYLQGAGALVEDAAIGQVDVVVVLGADFEGVVPPGSEDAAPAPATRTPSPRLISSVHGQDEAPEAPPAEPVPTC